MKHKSIDILVLDIDNTVFDWVTYYVHGMEGLIDKVAEITDEAPTAIAHQCRDVFERHNSIEYPFLIQELAAVNRIFGQDFEKMLADVVEPGRDAFLQAAAPFLTPYRDVREALSTFNADNPGTEIIALTDAPQYVAMWKLNKLGLLEFFDAIYGLPDPTIPVCNTTGEIKVSKEILIKHLNQTKFDFPGKVRELPEDYEKPATKGLKTVLMDCGMESSPEKVVWVGDNLRKDVTLGQSLGVKTVWAEYGTVIDPQIKSRLLGFSPEKNIRKNVAIDPADDSSPRPDYTIQKFSEILKIFI